MDKKAVPDQPPARKLIRYAVPPEEAKAFWDDVWAGYLKRCREKGLDDPLRAPSAEFLHRKMDL